MTLGENHYRREQQGGVVIGPLICPGAPTVGSSLIDRFQPALLGKSGVLARYMHMGGLPHAASVATNSQQGGLNEQACRPHLHCAAWLPWLWQRGGSQIHSSGPSSPSAIVWFPVEDVTHA